MRPIAFAFCFLVWSASLLGATSPNIVYIMADDLGIGDVKCYGGDRCKIETPAFDSLARDGMLFSDAHSVASVCVPSRIGIMTGRYAWRFAKPAQSGPWGFINPQLRVGEITLGSMLQGAGYRTSYVGKWHLGTLMLTTDGRNQGPENVNYDLPLEVGPNDYGFDYSFVLPGSLDMYPYVFAKNGQFPRQGHGAQRLERIQSRRPGGRGLRGLQGLGRFCPGGRGVHRAQRRTGAEWQAVFLVCRADLAAYPDQPKPGV